MSLLKSLTDIIQYETQEDQSNEPVVNLAPTPSGFSSRDELRAYLRSIGFKTPENVTKKTDILFVGPEWGRNKIEKAMRYGIPIIPYPFAFAIGYFSTRHGPGLVHSEPIKILTIQSLAIADDLHAQYLLTGDERVGIGLQCIVGLVQRLLLLSGGPIIRENPGGDQDIPRLDTSDLGWIIDEIRNCWIVARTAIQGIVDEQRKIK